MGRRADSRPTEHCGSGSFERGSVAMTSAAMAVARPVPSIDWRAFIDGLGPRFAERAAGHDADERFVAENYAELKQARLFAAGVPAELGGGNAAHAELCDML